VPKDKSSFQLPESFDPILKQTVSSALVDAWQRLNSGGGFFRSQAHAEYARDILERGVIESAIAGERDQTQLRDDGLLYWSKRHTGRRQSSECH
jgi:hypothetical protein